jgi:hypothetical protein
MIFDDDDLNKLGNAFDRAWDRFLRTGMLKKIFNARKIPLREVS